MLVKSDDETDIGVESGHSAKVEEQQRRYEYIQNREAIEVQWREEERMLYLSVCILSTLSLLWAVTSADTTWDCCTRLKATTTTTRRSLT